MTTDKKTATQHFTESFDDFCVGLVNLQHMRAIIAEMLNDEPRAAEMMLATIDTAFREGLIKASTYDELTTDVDRATSEDEPTEWSDATLAQESNDISADEDTGYPSTELTKTTDSPLPATVDLAPGSVLKNRFELVSHLGAGSMADVYEAIDRRQQEAGAADPRLAIKVISRAYLTHPHALKTLQHEALNSQGLINPNVIRVFDFDRDGDRFFMTMELLDGQSLVKILDERRFQPLPITQAVSIIKGMCRGLQYAHQQGIIHADIKPGNIYISTANQAKILDFGISRIANDEVEGDSSPVTGAHTPAYASCEVLEGAKPTKRDDIFALACVAYRMLAGHRAFDGLTALEAERKQYHPQRIETLNKQQWQVLQQSLALRCADRTVSLATFAAAFSNPSPAADTPQIYPESEPKSAKNYPELRGLPLQFGIPAIAVMLIAITMALFWPEPEPTPAPLARTEIFVPDILDPPTPEETQPAAEITPTPETEFVTPPTIAAPAIVAPTTIFTDEPTSVPAEPSLAVTPQPNPKQIRINELAMLADDAMNDGRLVEPVDNNARLFVTELATLEPDAAEVQPRQTRLADLMLLEAMVAITDENFDAATRWIEETRMLDVPEVTTQRFEIELQKARDAKSVRQTESIGAIFASATPAAIMANPPINYSNEQITTKAIITTDPVVVAGSLSLAMLQPGALTVTTTEVVEEEPAGETADTSNQDIALSALEFKHFVEPKIPRRLGARKVSGWVEVRFRVMTNGKTDNITVVAAEPDNRFEKSAVSAIKKWRFKPIYIDGIAIEKYSTIRLRFEP